VVILPGTETKLNVMHSYKPSAICLLVNLSNLVVTLSIRISFCDSVTGVLHIVGKKTIFFNSCDVSKSYSSSDLNVVIVFLWVFVVTTVEYSTY